MIVIFDATTGHLWQVSAGGLPKGALRRENENAQTCSKSLIISLKENA